MAGCRVTGSELHARIKVRQMVPNVDEIYELLPDAVREMEREWLDLWRQAQRKIEDAFDAYVQDDYEDIDDKYTSEPNFTNIWREVLHHVDSYDLFSLRCVSKSFKQLVDSILRRKHEIIRLNEYNRSYLQINHLFHFHIGVKTLILESLTLDIRVVMLLCKNRLPSLKTLYLANFKPFDIQSVEFMVECLPNVKCLEIYSQSITEEELCMFTATFRNVEQFTINGCNIGYSLHLISDNVKALLFRDVICREFDSFCLLKGIALQSFEYVMSWYCEDDQTVFDLVTNHLVNLKNFTFRSCIGLNFISLENLTNLKTLAICVASLNLQNLCVFSSLASVDELALNIVTISDENLSLFLSLFPNIAHLLIVKHYTTSILSETIEYITKSNIKTLTLEFYDKLDLKKQMAEEIDVGLIKSINEELMKLFEVNSDKTFYLDFMYPTDHKFICKRLKSIAEENKLKQYKVNIWTFQEEDEYENYPENLKVRYQETMRNFPFKDIMPFYE